MTVPVKSGYVFTTSKTGRPAQKGGSIHPIILNGSTFAYYVDGKKGEFWRPPATGSLSGWTFVGLSYDGKSMRLFVNGKLVGSAPGNFGTTLHWVGNRPGQHGHWSMINEMDDLFVFRRPLDADEMATLHALTARSR